MYEIIRVSGDYGVVIVEVSDSINPEHKTYIGYNTYWMHDKDVYKYAIAIRDVSTVTGDIKVVFRELTQSAALQYLGGIADSLGWGDIPKKPFASLDELLAWHTVKLKNAAKEWLRLFTKDAFSWQDEGPKIEFIDILMDDFPLTEDEFKANLRKYGIKNRWPEFQKRYNGKFKVAS